MKKLKLETLEVTSFETSSVPQGRGTLHAHADVKDPIPAPTAYPCHTTPDMDCTYGCSRQTDCNYNCTIIRLTETGCADTV